jgi:pyridoxal phosphate enzyme (YggS family)
MESYAYIGENLARIRETCEARAARLGVPAPRLLAVTKSASADEVRALVSEYGQDAIAENRTSLFQDRYEMFSDEARPEMHLIGSLQTNKVKYIAGKVALIHSLDSLRLAAEIEKQAAKRDVRIRALIEINSGREEAKGGLLFEEVEAFATAVKEGYPHVALSGVMTMAPVCTDGEAYRPYFRETARVFRTLSEGGFFEGTPVLSMGMSGSYEIAIEEGATVVRVGRALFAR